MVCVDILILVAAAVVSLTSVQWSLGYGLTSSFRRALKGLKIIFRVNILNGDCFIQTWIYKINFKQFFPLSSNESQISNNYNHNNSTDRQDHDEPTNEILL